MYAWPPNTHMYEWHTHNVYPCITYINIAGSQGTSSSSGFIASALLWTSSKCCFLTAQDRSYPEKSPRTGYGSPTFSFALDTVLPIIASQSLRIDRKRIPGGDGEANKNREKKPHYLVRFLRFEEASEEIPEMAIHKKQTIGEVSRERHIVGYLRQLLFLLGFRIRHRHRRSPLTPSQLLRSYKETSLKTSCSPPPVPRP